MRHIQNPVYLGIFRHIQAHSIIVTITLTFSFHFNVTYLSTKFKKTFFDYNDINLNAQLSLLK